LRHFGFDLRHFGFKIRDSLVETAAKDILRYEIPDVLAVRVTQVDKRAPRVGVHRRVQFELMRRRIR
jgi:hypothetical protein